MNYARNLNVLLLGVLVLAGCDTSINSSIIVPDGESRSGSLTSVNGDVSIGEDCTIEGASRSVNGSVQVGNRSRVEELTVVNGTIRTGTGVRVDGNVESVNGAVEFGAGSEVAGKVSSVNASIILNQTMVQRDVLTMYGNIKLRDKSVVKGNIVIGDNLGVIETDDRTGVVMIEDKIGVIVINGKKSDPTRPIEIEVTGGSIIEGNVIVTRNVKVRLILRDGGKVLGKVDGVEVIDNNVALSHTGLPTAHPTPSNP